MAKETIDVLIEGGKATAAPPLGPKLGPLGVNIGEVVSSINKATESFKGMQVPVKVIIDSDTKEFDIKVGTPPASALILKETGIAKGSGNPKMDKVADILIEQIIKIAKMKNKDLLGKTLKQKIKEIVGTCNSMGVLVEGVPAVDAIKLINQGKFDEEIKSEKTELSAEEMKKLDVEKAKLKADIEKRRAEYERSAKDIIDKMSGKSSGEVRSKLKEAKIPIEIIDELAPAEGAAAAKEGEKPAEKKEEKKE